MKDGWKITVTMGFPDDVVEDDRIVRDTLIFIGSYQAALQFVSTYVGDTPPIRVDMKRQIIYT